MASLNKVMLIGNVGKDPEMRYTANGKAVTTFSVACNRVIGGGDGERREETDWFDVVAWDKLAELCSQYLQKGRQIYVEGRLRTSKYKDKEGNERTSTEVVANTVQFLGSGQGRPGGGAPREGAPRDTGAPRDAGPVDDAPAGDGGGFIDDDLPF